MINDRRFVIVHQTDRLQAFIVHEKDWLTRQGRAWHEWVGYWSRVK